MNPTLTALLTEIAALPADALDEMTGHHPALDILRDRIVAWRRESAPVPVGDPPPVGSRVTLANVAALPVGAVVEWLAFGQPWTVARTDTNKWHCDLRSQIPWTDAEIAADEPPAFVHSLPTPAASLPDSKAGR